MFKNINWNISNICRLIIPLILGFSMNAIPQCKMNKNAGSVVKFRPPSYMFGIVWTILYILFGPIYVTIFLIGFGFSNYKLHKLVA